MPSRSRLRAFWLVAALSGTGWSQSADQNQGFSQIVEPGKSASGSWGSTRKTAKDTDEAAGGEPEAADEPQRATTVEDARGSFDTLVKSYLTKAGGRTGVIQLKDPRDGRLLTLNYVRSVSKSVHEIGKGLFAGDVLFRGPGGKTVTAQALLDLRAEEWLVTKLELLGARKPPPGAKDIGRVFGAAVLKKVQEDSRAGGVFTVDDPWIEKRRALKLRMIPSDGIVDLGDTRYRSCVFFVDAQDGSPVDVDFLANIDGQTATVYQVALHQVAGKPRFVYDGRNNMVPLDPAHAAPR